MTTTTAHRDIVKEAMQALEVQNCVPGRENLAGIHLTADAPAKTIYGIALTPMYPGRQNPPQLSSRQAHPRRTTRFSAVQGRHGIAGKPRT
jgi:hypothetical protein